MAYIKHKVVTQPAEQPVSLADVKLHLRLIPNDTTEDEGILIPLIHASREYCENVIGRALGEQTIAAYPGLGAVAVPLPKPPAIAVETVTVYEEDGTGVVLDPSAYFFDEVSDVLYLPAMPGRLRAVNPIEILYRAGQTQIPFAIRQAMLLLIGHWYENREAVEVGAIANIQISLAVDALLNQYKVWWF